MGTHAPGNGQQWVERRGRGNGRIVSTRSGVPYTGGMRSHEWIDARSRALHEAVAARLEADPGQLEVARANLRRWLARDTSPALKEWEALLDRTPLAELVALLRSSSDDAARLRQSSPFAGLLAPEERRAILNAHESPRT